MSYASVADLKVQLAADGVSAPPAADVLQGLLDNATADVDRYCRRDFVDHPDDTVTVVGKGRDSLLLPVYPVRAITAASIRTPGSTCEPYALTASELAALIVLPFGKVLGYRFPLGAVVTFTCDWGYPGDPPVAAQTATLRLASRQHRHGKARERVAEGVRSESVEGYSISFDPLEMDRDVASLLEPLRKKRAAA